MAAVVASAALPAVASAQSRPVAVDLTLGADDGRSREREYAYTRGAALGLTVAWRARPAAELTRVLAFDAGVRGAPAHGDVCWGIRNPDGSWGGCRPEYPALAHFGILGGIEQVTRGASGRALIGPAFYMLGRSGIGGQVRLDGAFPGRSHVAFVASLRGSAIRRFSGESLGLLGFSFGVRFQ